MLISSPSPHRSAWLRVFLVRMEYKTVAAGSLPVKRGDFVAELRPGFRVVLEYYEWVSLYITI